MEAPYPESMRLITYTVSPFIHFFFEYVAEAVGSRTHAEACGIDLANDSMCMLVIVKREQTLPPPFWFTIKRKAVFVWVPRCEGTPPALAVTSFVQVNSHCMVHMCPAALSTACGF